MKYEYVSEVNRMKGKSPLLFVGKAGLIHLYLLAEFIQKKDELLSKKNQTGPHWGQTL